MKVKIYLLAMLMVLSLVGIAGCTNDTDTTTTASTTTTSGTDPDVVSAASFVDDAAGFAAAVDAVGGTWIICATDDVTVSEELTLGGTYFTGDDNEDGTPEVQRKIALYAQDADRNVTEEYTLTVPTLIVTSPNALLMHGSFVGDLVVAVDGFEVRNVDVDGNIYFTSQENMDSFIIDDESTVTGEQEIVPDVTAAASFAENADGFEAAIDAVGGTWIICATDDITATSDLTMGGTYYTGDDNEDGTPETQRKIALYEQDADRNVTAEFTLTVPTLTVTSPNALLMHGSFVGDLIVAVDGFEVRNVDVTGNIYFTSQGNMDSFIIDDESTVSGEQALLSE